MKRVKFHLIEKFREALKNEDKSNFILNKKNYFRSKKGALICIGWFKSI
jgi:hypothetical protein